MSPAARNTLGWAMVYQNYLLLPLAAVSSIQDFAGPLIRTRDFQAAWQSFKYAIRSLRDPAQRAEFADILNTVNGHISQASLAEQYGSAYMNNKQLRLNEALFKYNQLERITNMTRTFGAAVAQQFILRHSRVAVNGSGEAQAEAIRYLDELGISPEQALRWEQDGKQFWSSERAETWSDAQKADEEAMRRAVWSYVEQSVLRPNAAQRPVWMSNPVYGLLAHLKSFLYSMGKIIINGALLSLIHI